MGKNDSAWKTFVEKSKFVLDGRPYIFTSKKLKKIADREPRLMAKADKPNDLPKVFRDAGYSLIAIQNGVYLIFKGTVFAPVPDCSESAAYQPQLDFPTKTIGRGTGESEYIDNAFNTGLISEFTGSEKMYLTIRGKERTKKFSFLVSKSDEEISVSGVQIEVDAGYETEDEIILIEGKTRDLSFFNIRQLYYPFVHFSNLVPEKKVRTLFFVYSLKKATYALYEFGFKNSKVFDSIYPIKCCVYRLVEPRNYAVGELLDENYETQNNIVPQADVLGNILDLLVLINSGSNSVPEIADYFEFDKRQSNYYGEAAEFLGLITRKRGYFELSERGSRFISTNPKDQRLFIVKLVINSWLFKKLIEKSGEKGYFTKMDIEELISGVPQKNKGKRYSKSTISRRRTTIVSWLRWISEELKSFEFDGEKIILK